jgi:cysteine desulfurase/selenocysteine lyase
MIIKEKISGFNVAKVREDFPILETMANGKPLIYFDNGATSQKPQLVIDTINIYYDHENANVHRGVYYLSQIATDLFDESRKKIAKFINAEENETVLFTSGTTESINLVAQTWGRQNLNAGDEVLISGMEHHSNIVPWQMICEEKGAFVKVIPLLDDGSLNMEVFEERLNKNTKMVAVAHISNTLGVINPIEKIIAKAHAVGAKVLIDGAQALPHIPVDVTVLDCDFYAFSGHKMFAPTGIGVLYGKRSLLESMPPYKGGGDMIDKVTFEKTTYADLPFKFEAGTPNIAGVIGMGAAVDYLNKFDWNDIVEYEEELLRYITDELQKIEGLRIYGTTENKVPVISFLVDNIHPYDIGTLLDQMGIAVRTGHHCTQPLMDRYCIPGTVRASLAFYNTKEEIDIFINALNRVLKILRK